MSLLHGTLPAPYRALLVVPIRVHDAIYGCLLLFYAQPYVFAPEEVALAQTYADQVALAIGNSRLQAHIEREAAVAERTRLAHELHDTVTQEMYSAVLLAESITRNWQGHRAEAEMALKQLPGVIRGALAGLRTLLFELRPATLEHLPLSALLRQLGEAMSLRADVPIAVRLNDSEGASSDVEPPLPPAVKVVFYRVAQEALMNAAKYARAHAISVQLRTRGRGTRSTIELEIADDGRGFDPSAISAGHFGLVIMRERAHDVGATVQIRSQPGQGTQIVAVWPRERGGRGERGATMPETANGQPREAANGRPRHRKLKGGTA
jgi:signal transduction histidine kinase